MLARNSIDASIKRVMTLYFLDDIDDINNQNTPR